MQILKVLVGSHAHGLATPESDRDYRGVFVTPTSDLLRIGVGKPKGHHWAEGGTEDDTAYELAHFLHLATKSNPSILEVFVAPVEWVSPRGWELRSLFPHVWSSKAVLEAFRGYGLNQRKKMLSDKQEFSGRAGKYGAAYIRTLIQGATLLMTGELEVKVPGEHMAMMRKIKEGEMSVGRVIDLADRFTTGLLAAYECNMGKQVDMEPVNEFLLRVRKSNWS